METVFPITALQKNTNAVREQACQGLVRITENGRARYVFCAEEVFARTIAEACEDAVFEARMMDAIARGIDDLDKGRYVTTFEEVVAQAGLRCATNERA